MSACLHRTVVAAHKLCRTFVGELEVSTSTGGVIYVLYSTTINGWPTLSSCVLNNCLTVQSSTVVAWLSFVWLRLTDYYCFLGSYS